MKILIIQNTGFLNGKGGTEKIAAFLANNLSSFYDVEFVTNDININGKPVFSLNDNVKLINIYEESKELITLIEYYNYKGNNIFKWIKNKIKKKYQKHKNKKTIKKYKDKETIFQHNLMVKSKIWNKYLTNSDASVIITMSINSLLEITYKNEDNIKIPILNSVNGRPDYDYSDILWYRSKIEQSLLKDSYKKLSGIQILFDSYKKFLPETFTGICKTIPNPTIQIEENQTINHSIVKEKYKIINIGTLNISCKQQDKAILAFSKLANNFLNWELHFWGVGNDFEDLEKLIKKLNLENRIFLNGFTNKPIEELKDSDIFIFPSKYEGFPLALVEAMSVGLPVIGLQSCSGVNELIKHKKSGYLSENEEDLSIYLEKLMINNETRQNFGYNGHIQMKSYSSEIIIKNWKSLIETVTK